MHIFVKIRRVTLVFIFASLWSHTVSAQAIGDLTTTSRPIVDSRGVDIQTGKLTSGGNATGIGDLISAQSWSGKTAFNLFSGYVAASGSDRIVFINGRSFRFTSNGSSYSSADADGSTLVSTTSPERYTYTASDGTVFQFIRLVSSQTNRPLWNLFRAHLVTVTRADGHSYTYNYNSTDGSQICGITCYNPTYVRPQSVVSSDGYMLKAGYASTSAGTEFNKMVDVQAIDLSEDYCNPSANSCTGLTQSWSMQTISESVNGSNVTQNITDEDGNTTSLTLTGGQMAIVAPPTSTGGGVQTTYDTNGRVTSIQIDGATYTYNYSINGTTQTTTVTGPNSTSETYVVDTNTSRLMSKSIAGVGQTTYQYDSSARVTRETLPEGNYTQLTYDNRGNVTQVRNVAKPGSGIADIVASASFDASCTNIKKCNKPNYTIDARGNRTDFTYDANHGGITKVRLPAPITGGVRPEINYTYSLFYAKIKNASGTLVNAPNPEYKISQISTCSTASTCLNTANETKITIAYNTPNLLPSSKTVAAGDGSISATETYTYDVYGNLRSVDGPLAGTADTTWFYYTKLGKLRAKIYADPDGAGPLVRRAERYFYIANLPLLKIEIGTATSSDINSITATQTVEYENNNRGRPVKETLTAGGQIYQIVQKSYDTKGRLECTAVRLNPAIFSSLPPSACTLGTPGTGVNDFGPDRIRKNFYDSSDRIVKVQAAVDTSNPVDEIITGYTLNGKTAYVIDAELNRTTYSYDGHDRLIKTNYPVQARGNNTSSTSDYEQWVYGAEGSVIQKRLRDGTAINYGYDNFGRLVLKDLPSAEPDATYNYDLLGQLLSITQNSQTITFGYDALGRNGSQSGPHGTLSFLYDSAGQRIQLTYPGGGLHINYDYDAAGNITKIRENGASSGSGILATYIYDSLGRRNSVTFGNGTTQSFTYDPVSRLSALTSNLAGTAYDVTTSFTYNPASQIKSTIKNNDSYSWDNSYNVSRNYISNGLNQLTLAGAITLSYDIRGNLSTSDGNSYTYSSENFLKNGPNGTSLEYDPLGRLYQTTGSGVTTRFAYDGANMIAEYNATNALLRRYVHGPGTDEPILWYEGSGTSDKRYLHTDERGSIIAATDASGVTVGINSYDEYGIPDSANIGRFSYTGQTWLPEIGMHYYKARIYSPTLGRFLQADPIGYDDGLNLYNYVTSDPVNFRDPTGLSCERYPGGYIAFKDINGNGKYDRDVDELSRIGVCADNSATRIGGAGRSGGGFDVGRIGSGGGATPPCSSSPSDGFLGTARAVLETTSTVASLATLGFTAGGVTAPIAPATALVGATAEAGLLIVNVYDASVNGNSGGLTAQLAGISTRFIPGGRALQKFLKFGRGPVPNKLGQSRIFSLDNEAVANAGDLLIEDGVQNAVSEVVCK